MARTSSIHFIGLELSGPRSDQTHLCSLDIYPSSGRCILSSVQRCTSDEDQDGALISQIKEFKKSSPGLCSQIFVGAPMGFPPMMASLISGKMTKKQQEELAWLKKFSTETAKKGKARQTVTYIQRPAELYLRHLSREKFPLADSFSSSGAALAARLLYCRKQLRGFEFHEVYTRGSVQRLCKSLSLPSSVSNNYSHLSLGLEARNNLLSNLESAVPGFFFYEELMESLITNIHAFNSFILALCGVLSRAGATEAKPPGFPKSSDWIWLPKTEIRWDKMFE